MNLHFTLEIVPRTKKNSNLIGWRKTLNKETGDIKYSPYIRASEKYTEFEKQVLDILPKDLKLHINTLVNVKAHFYCKSRRKIDLTNLLEALDDALVKAGVLEDDNRNIIAAHDGSRVYWDKKRPRIEIWIEPFLEEYQEWKTK